MPTPSDITSYPKPAPDELSAPFWHGVKQESLVIQRCRSCGRYIHWPQYVCRDCLSDDLEYMKVSGDGSLYAFSVTVHPFHPGFASKVPYTLAIIELAEQEQLRLVSQVVDCQEESLQIGMPLRVTFRSVAPDLVLPLFTPC
jgi:uncharacterized protein